MIRKIIFRNLLHKPLTTLLSIILLMFGVGIISLILLIYRQMENKFDNDLKDVDLVVGAKGSPLQLVLSAVYHIDAPTGNILLADAARIIHDPLVEQAIPLAYGDSYKSFRIVGTDSQYLEKYAATFKEGNLFRNVMEAVVGKNVADATGLKRGDSFFGTHGLGSKGHVHKEFAYTVVGILKPSNTVLDNLVLTNIETVWKIHEHHHHDGDNDEKDEDANTKDSTATRKPENEITALLIKFRSPMGIMTLPRIINETTSMQSASPTLEISRLFDLMGIGVTTLQMVALAIMLISGLSVFISLYIRLKERKYELALVRSLGSSRSKLFLLIFVEGLLLSLIGFAAGICLSRLGLFLLNLYSSSSYHIHFTLTEFIPEEYYLLLVTMGIGITASLIPAVKAFNLNISKTLADD
jgi:putative ABC transport system permease protein